MSQFPPPSFDGQQNYAPPWPMQFPDTAKTSHQHTTNLYTLNNNPLSIGNFPPFPFSPQTPGQLPGLGMPNHPIPQPSYLSKQFPNAQANSSPYTPGFPVDVSTSSSHPSRQTTFTPRSEAVDSLPIQSVVDPLKASLPMLNDDTDREEGELSDGSGLVESSRQHSWPHTESNRSQPRPEATVSGDQAASHTNTAYAPSTNATANEVLPEQVPNSTEDQMHKSESAKPAGYASLSGKSPAQVRIMAQGALLRLAPHNIRFNELVKEDINPAILKQLYDDIGIKVNAIGTKPTEQSVSQLDAATKSKRANPSQILVSETGTSSISSVSDKPLERKDVIARMLAEKAKKKMTHAVFDLVPTDSVTNTSGSVQTVENTAQIPLSSKSQSPVQSKEKNKAQTELARQRIEQLKKMGLKRQQTHPETPNYSQTSSSDIENTTSKATVLLHHPLPERPPVIEQVLGLPKPSTPQTPGVSLPSESAKTGSPLNSENRAVGASTPFRNSLGKRPRASDFDELIPEIKNPLMPESRLVIDISEDESFNDDEEDEDVVMSENSGNYEASKGNGTMHRDAISRNAISASSTPQSRPSDSESLRLKNLEIQAMRRRIAEWEEKNAKKAKIALPSVTAADTVPQPSAQIGVAQSVLDKTTSTPTPIEKSSFQNLPRSPSAHSLASMDSSDLDRMRQKLLRKREIESGLPALDAELLKFETKLAEFKRQEEQLLNEISKSREERKLLGDELQSLGVETEGLSLEELKAAKEDIERAAATQGRTEPHGLIPEPTPSPKDPKTATTILDFPQPMDDYLPPLEQKPSPSESHSYENTEMNDTANVEDSISKSPGSSMDESTSDAESGSESESESEQPSALLPMLVEPKNSYSAELPHASTLIPAVESEPTVAVSENGVLEAASSSRESSVLSDNYEPPEPEEADEAYSPKLSPSGIEDSQMETLPSLPTTQEDTNLKLTRKPQEAVAIAYKGDALDNTPNMPQTVLKFSPYQSPLKYFRAYRYHPNYVENVGDSYRSLTYSHKIDPSRAVCPYEAAGGVCNDATCEFQHWREMVMPDDKILVEMGNQKEGKTPEEQEAYIAGLKELINNMRRDQVKDFSTVASEIAAYRRRFLSDPSRILPP